MPVNSAVDLALAFALRIAIFTIFFIERGLESHLFRQGQRHVVATGVSQMIHNLVSGLVLCPELP
jgi:hypothetical protein